MPEGLLLREPSDLEVMEWAETCSAVEIKDIGTDQRPSFMVSVTEPCGMTWIYFTPNFWVLSKKLRSKLLEAHFNDRERRDA